MPREQSKAVDGIIVDGAELAVWLGVTRARVSQMVEEQIIPRPAKGEHPLKECVQNYCEYARRSSRGTNSAKEEQIERTRLTRVKADIAELDHAERHGELLRADAIHKQDQLLATTLKNNLLSMPDRIASLCAAESDTTAVFNLITSEVNHSLQSIIDSLSKTEVDDATLDITRREALDHLEQASAADEQTEDE